MTSSAGRQLACLASCTSDHTCSVCTCRKKDGLGRTDFTEWKTRDPGILKKAATTWRDALSVSDQDKIFSAYGVRWSEMWRLPYWNPVKQLVVDPMHCLLEGLAQNHFRYVLGLTSSEAKVKDPVIPAFTFEYPSLPDPDIKPTHYIYAPGSGMFLTDKELSHLPKIYDILRMPLDNGLDSFRNVSRTCTSCPLKYACRSLNIYPSQEDEAYRRGLRSKVYWITLLEGWVGFLVVLLSIILMFTSLEREKAGCVRFCSRDLLLHPGAALFN